MSSEGSPPRPTRRVRRLLVETSSSSSDSDESVGTSRTRKKRLRVFSDEEASESSGSSVVEAGARRRRLPRVRESGDSDTSGGVSGAPAPGPAPPLAGFSSDSSEGDSDKCSICLMRFTDQQVGTPQTCEHIFCLDCITEWSNNVNTCPVDRITFDSIVVRSCINSRVLRTEPVRVTERRSSVDMLVVEDPTFCEICRSSESEETMLLCDGCDLGYHMGCLTPPLQQIPVDEWLCQECAGGSGTREEDYIYLSEVNDLLLDIEDIERPLPPRPHPLRQPSTARRSARNRNDTGQPSAADGTELNTAEVPSTSRGLSASSSRPPAPRPRRRAPAAAPRPRAPRARRKYKRRRTKTVVIEYEVRGDGKFPVTKRIKRRIKKRKSRARPRTAARRTHVRQSVRAQLAALRAGGAGAGGAAGDAKGGRVAGTSVGVQALSLLRHRAGVTALSLFGSRDQLDYWSEEEQPAPGGGGGAAVSRPAPPALPATRHLALYRQGRRKLVSLPSPPRAASAAPDLLSSIMESQSLLHSRSTLLSVGVDGQVNIKLRAERAARQAPAYPGQPRGHGAGGWGGGYRGNYHREQGSTFNRGSYEAGNYSRGPRHPAAEHHAWRDADADEQFAPARHQPYPDHARQHYPQRPDRGRHSLPPPPAPPHHPPPPPRRSLDMSTGPLPEPPVFEFASTAPDRDEEDEAGEGLVIDTDKYDPTEPTHDEGSGDEVPAPLPLPPAPLPPPPALSHMLAGLVPAGVLDTAVRQVLREHRGLVAAGGGGSDDDEDGDCPNFSIYSATSVHIASASSSADEPLPPPPPPPLPLLAPRADTTEEDQLKEKVSRRCPITPNARNPIKIKLNTPSLIKRVSLYDEDDEPEPATPPAPSPVPADLADPSDKDTRSPEAQKESPSTDNDKDTQEITQDTDVLGRDEEAGEAEGEGTPSLHAASTGRDSDQDDATEHELDLQSPSSRPGHDQSPSSRPGHELDRSPSSRPGCELDQSPSSQPGLEKMTESISETEDERSYTPCLDENKSKDTSLETEREAGGGIEGLDTELISDEEGNDIFSGEERARSSPAPPARQQPSPLPALSPPPALPTAADREDGELAHQDDAPRDTKKKDSRKDAKDKSKGKKKPDVAFKKLSKSGKERNYRDKEDRRRRARSDSSSRSGGDRERSRREKRKDLERYDVRNVVTGKRSRVTDAFGRDVTVSRSPSAPPAAAPHLAWPPAPRRRSASRAPSPPPPRRSLSSRRHSPPKKRRKSPSPRRRSASRARKVRDRSGSVRRRRSASRGRKRRRSASRSPKPKQTKKKKRARSERRSPSRPKDVDKEKKKRARKRSRSARRKSPKQKKNKKRSPSPPLELSPPAAAWSPPPPRAWSRSVDSRLLSPRTPPPDLSPDPRHLRVILANEDKQKRRKERRRLREVEKRHKRAKDATGPSKEVFTSGNNILVSVSFDKEGEESAGRRRRRGERRLRRERRRQQQQGAETEGAAKPVAIIDLERSPFRELTPSPKNVIVLSDSEPGDKEPQPDEAPAAPAAPPAAAAAPPAAATGPKTPPEPAVKFSIPSKPAPQLRANPLGADEEDGPAEETAARGPNTPPSPPASPASSPDAYDPFEPTRSPSPPAAPAAAAAAGATPPPEPASMTLEAAQRTNLSADDVLAQRPLTPSEKVMALLQSTRDVEVEAPPSGDAASAAESQADAAAAQAQLAAATPVHLPAASPARPALAVTSTQRIVLPSPTKGSPLKSQPPKLFLAKPSPIKSTPIKPLQSTKISKLPLPHVKPVLGARRGTRNGGGDVIDLEFGESPYSPGSSDFGDLFDPPPGGRGGGGGGRGHDMFDSLLGGGFKLRRDKTSATKVPVKQIKKKGGRLQVGVKVDENNLKVLDELPSSAVEMQVKSKFLKKLNRQERVVEEVKLVLKPHYNKKRLTKDEYKDVLRRAVPKICHNKSGEINPAKIQALVEAYVRKIRKRRKLGLA